MNAIINEVVYEVFETMTGHFVTATIIADIYADDNDVSENPVLSGAVIGTGKTRKQAFKNAEKEIQTAVEQLTAQKGGA